MWLTEGSGNHISKAILLAGLSAALLAGCQTHRDAGPTVQAPQSSAAVPAPALSPERAELENARLLYTIGRQEESYRIALRLSDQGFGEAHNLVYIHHSANQGVVRNEQVALAALRKGVAAGDPKAEANLGGLYLRGRWVDRDYGKARELIERSAAKGNRIGLTWLAIMYRRGEGVPKDVDKARELDRQTFEILKRDAAAGDPAAPYALGRRYLTGRGTDRDIDRGLSILRDAADRGYLNAIRWLARDYRRGRFLKVDKAEHIRWLRKAADVGHKTSQLNLGLNYRTGYGVEKNLDTAKSWMRKAAAKGHRFAAHELAKLLLVSSDTASKSEGVDWLRRNSESGFYLSMGLYGYANETGLGGTERDPVAALRWYRLALKGNHRIWNDRIGGMYLFGRGVEKSRAQAVRHLEAALKVLKPGKRRDIAEWMRALAMARLTNEEFADLKNEGLLAEYNTKPDGKKAAELTAKLYRGLARSNPAKFREHFAEWLKNHGKDSSSPFVLSAALHLENDNFQKALKEVNAGIELGDRTPRAYTVRGIVYYKLGDFEKSVEDFTRVIKVLPKLANVYALRGFAHLQLRTREGNVRGLADLLQAHHLEPENPRYRKIVEDLGLLGEQA